MPMVLMSGWIAADALDRDGLVKRRSGTTEQPGTAHPPAADVRAAAER
jgi:hypothetical protein